SSQFVAARRTILGGLYASPTQPHNHSGHLRYVRVAHTQFARAAGDGPAGADWAVTGGGNGEVGHGAFAERTAQAGQIDPRPADGPGSLHRRAYSCTRAVRAVRLGASRRPGDFPLP